MASSTRATRSRYSSPAQTQNHQNGTPDTPKEPLSQSSKFMAKWLEPAIQKKASYEEAGLVKQGVLEGMAPLGAMPKGKKPPGDGSSSVRKIILRPSGGNANAAPSPREPASAPKDPAASSSASPQPLPAPACTPTPTSPQRRKLPLVPKEEDGDDDYDPKATGSRRRQSGRVTKGKKPLPSSASRPATSRPAPPLTTDPEVKDFANKVVEAAVSEAIQHYRYPTAYALRTLYDERSAEPGFVAMIEDVFSQTADADTVTEFASLLEEKKREGKKDDSGVHFFAVNTTSKRETPGKPQPAPYAKMLKNRNPDADEQGVSPRAAKKIKIRHSRTPSKGDGIAAAAIDTSKIKTPSSRKRNRRESGSSDSSLSTTMSLSPFDTHGKKSAAILQSPVSPSTRGAATSAADGAQATTTDNANDGSNPQPITTHGKTFVAPAARDKGVSSASSDSHSPSLPHQQQRPSRRSRVGRSSSPAVGDARMPGRISSANLFPNLPRKPSNSPSKQDAEPEDCNNKDEDLWEKKWEAKRVTEDYTAQHSFLRGSSPDEKATPKVTTRKTRQSLLPSAGTRATRSASKRPNDDLEDTISPRAPSWNGDASSTVGSRAVTPSSLRPAAKKVKTGIRIKLSPIKKKGAAGGLPRQVGETQGAPNGASREQTTDNDEYCSACGNAGDVLCCDGCPRSFHFECVDMEQDQLPDEWYCNECLFRRFPRRIPVHKGIFGGALNNLEKSNPRAFSLPKKIQNRFDGVKAGPDGDYDEVVSKQSRDKKRNVYDENAGPYPMREDGRPILCHNCQKGDSSPQELIPCSACPLWWHLHCLETPAAHMPNKKTWLCPAHVGDVTAEAHPLAPAHRFRKLKNAQVITPALGRGLKNNGQIELDWGDEPEPLHTGWPDTQSFGRTYKLPVNGVILDFVEQLRRSGAGYGPRQDEPKWIQTTALPAAQPEAPLKGSAMARHLEEVQASLTLTSLQRDRSDGVEQLTSALLSAADPNVLGLMARTNADNIEFGKLTDDDRLGLRAMMLQMDAISARIRKTLGEDSASAASALASPGATSVAEDTPVSSPRNKLQAIAPATEPTPPSTIGQGEGGMDLD